MIEVEVKKSDIHGKGVFAKEDVNAGELIGVYEGVIMWKGSDPDPYILWLEDTEGRWYGVRGTGDMKYLNHDGDNPNAVLGANGPFVFCAQHIEAGEEITISYGDEIDFSEEASVG